MNRRGDCICAIPALPPERHHPHCPVRRRVEVHQRVTASDLIAPFVVRPNVEFRDLLTIVDGQGFVVLTTHHPSFAALLQRLLTAWCTSRGAGGGEAPRKARDARPGAPGERPRTTVGTPTTAHPTPPLGPVCSVCLLPLRFSGNTCEPCPEHAGTPPTWPKGGPPKGGA